ncbi:hypothetical protein HOG17_04685 [Candidatus Peregrinibacteria bacterium]|jgi:hypothetical protein|nr:hypothetical protein [Candidatus Peregrinibacteria bacterium]MBT4147862.1 hypothetical protein [Candidatus Peregrinibacteria bacterium]MBT4456310.1 hypothetical protein [Candidatus Peregrinibacteria bacterium]
MTNEEIVELMKNSEAFKTQFSLAKQSELIKKVPSLPEAKRVELVKALVEESDNLNVIALDNTNVLQEFETGLAELMQKAEKEFQSIVEAAEKKALENKLDSQLKVS